MGHDQATWQDSTASQLTGRRRARFEDRHYVILSTPGNRRGVPRPGLACCAAAPGTTIRTTRARTTATTTTRTTATTTTVFVCCVRPTSTFFPPDADRSRRSRFAGCGGGRMDGAGTSCPHAVFGVGRISKRGAAQAQAPRRLTPAPWRPAVSNPRATVRPPPPCGLRARTVRRTTSPSDEQAADTASACSGSHPLRSEHPACACRAGSGPQKAAQAGRGQRPAGVPSPCAGTGAETLRPEVPAIPTSRTREQR